MPVVAVSAGGDTMPLIPMRSTRMLGASTKMTNLAGARKVAVQSLPSRAYTCEHMLAECLTELGAAAAMTRRCRECHDQQKLGRGAGAGAGAGADTACLQNIVAANDRMRTGITTDQSI
jgi:hypothetical protein